MGFFERFEPAHEESQNQSKKIWKISFLLINELVSLLKKCMYLKRYLYLAEEAGNYSGEKWT